MRCLLKFRDLNSSASVMMISWSDVDHAGRLSQVGARTGCRRMSVSVQLTLAFLDRQYCSGD